MRITGQQGSGSGQSSSGQDRSDPEAFRRGRRVGQIVRGRLVAPGPNGLFWVVLAGHKLLASLDHEPAPGRELVFRILGLEPDLVLKDITPPPSASSDPGLLLAALVTARSRFERHLARLDVPAGPPLDLTEARRRFAAWLAASAEASADFDAVRELFRLVVAFLPRGEGRPIYAPWVFPGLTQTEGLISRLGREAGGPGFSLRLFGRLETRGLVAVQAAWHPGQTVYRLMLQRQQEAEVVMAALSRLRFGRAVLAPVCLAAGPLPGEYASGLLAPLLAVSSRPFTGLRLRV